MSQCVVFMVPDEWHIERWERLLISLEGVLVEGGGEPRELSVQRPDRGEIARLRELGPAREVADGYRANGLYPPSWRVGLAGKRFFQAQYSNWLPFRDFLTTLLHGWQGDWGTLQIDDDYGEIWPMEALVQSLSSDSAWDWRRIKSWNLSLASRQPIAFEDLAEALRKAHAGWGAIDPRLAELPWMGDAENRCRTMPLNPSFFAFRSEEIPVGDPILSSMLTETFGFSVMEHACFSLRFSDLSLAKIHLATLLEALEERRSDVLVDFDDLVLDGQDALQWLSLDPAWDWR